MVDFLNLTSSWRLVASNMADELNQSNSTFRYSYQIIILITKKKNRHCQLFLCLSMERRHSVMFQFKQEKNLCAPFTATKIGQHHPVELLHYDGVFGSIPITSFLLLVFVSTRSSQLFSVFHYLSVINFIQMKFVDLETENRFSQNT